MPTLGNINMFNMQINEPHIMVLHRSDREIHSMVERQTYRKYVTTRTESCRNILCMN